MPPSDVTPAQTLLLTRVTNSPFELARKAHAVLADRFPPFKVRHKPLSILRQEGRRALEQLFDADYAFVPKPDRDKLIEDILGEADGFGPLEELFRDDAMKEVMVLAAGQVIGRRGSGWTPTSVQFRDAVHLRRYLQRLADTCEPTGVGGLPTAGFDVRLPNGFRAIGMLPPEVLELPPTALFARGEAGDPPPPPPFRSGVIGNRPRAAPSPHADGGSSAMPVTSTQRQPAWIAHATPARPIPGLSSTTVPAFSGPLPVPAERVPPNRSGVIPPPDPFDRIRQRVTERIVRKCAAAGVFDLRGIPTQDLQRVITAHLEEANASDKFGLDDTTIQRLTLEILTGMNR
jgi:pilus assembly protein CpaF